jgi:hypothetical protein
MSDDDILKSAGIILDQMSPEEQAAIATLSREDLESLAAIRTKLNDAAEVSGHMRADPVGFCVW